MKLLAADLYPRIVRAKLEIDGSLGADMRLEMLANSASLSKFHFIRLFRAVYGCTPHQYVMAVRLEHARTLLGTGLLLEEVCVQLGLESVGSFAVLFKRRYGQTPARYRLASVRRQQLLRSAPQQFVPGCFQVRLGMARPSGVPTKG